MEILEDGFLNGKRWDIDGESYDVKDAWEDMVEGRKWQDLRQSNNGRAPDVNLPQTPMYKINKAWIKSANKSGATIIDLGNPSVSNSIFYQMEVNSVNWGG